MSRNVTFTVGCMVGIMLGGAIVAAVNGSWFSAVGMACCALTVAYRTVQP